MTTEIENKIKKHRLDAGLTQVKLAEISGVSCRTIQDWERGINKPRDVYVLQRVARALSCSIEDLINN